MCFRDFRPSPHLLALPIFVDNDLSLSRAMVFRRVPGMDLDRLPQLMVTIGQVRSVDGVLRSIVTGLAQDRSVVLARIWLAGPGDLCGSCQFRADCPDQARCLHLAASAGNAGADRTDYSRLTGTFRRIPIGYRKVGLVAKDRVGRLLVSPDTEWAEP